MNGCITDTISDVHSKQTKLQMTPDSTQQTHNTQYAKNHTSIQKPVLRLPDVPDVSFSTDRLTGVQTYNM
jgi:hypothetical protein